MRKFLFLNIKFLTLAFSVFISGFSFAQLSIDTSFNAQKLVDSFLVGQGIRVANVVYKGTQSSLGYFRCDNNTVGLENGIFLSTGKATDAEGPNNSPWTT